MPTPNPPVWEVKRDRSMESEQYQEMKKCMQHLDRGIRNKNEPLSFTSTVSKPNEDSLAETWIMDDMLKDMADAIRVPLSYMGHDLGLCQEIEKPEKPMKPKTVKLTIYYDNGKPFTVNNVRFWKVDDNRNIHYSAFKNKSGSRMNFTFDSTSDDVSVVVTYDGDTTMVNNFNPNNVTVNVDVKRY